MIPKNIVREAVDNDFFKYDAFTLCQIKDVKVGPGGLHLRVYPLEGLNSTLDGKNDTVTPTEFTAICINRDIKSCEKDIPKKYFALVLNVVKARPKGSPALLVPKTKQDIFDYVGDSEDAEFDSEDFKDWYISENSSRTPFDAVQKNSVILPKNFG